MEVPVELKRKYLERRIQDLELLRSALIHNDFSQALKLGHQVKGNAVTFDFPQMTQYGVAIEKAAQLQDKEKVFSIINMMEEFILSARNALLGFVK